MRIRRFPLLALATLGILALPTLASAADIAWRSWDDGLAEASRSGRPILVDVYTDWCTWCKRMDRDVYSRADVSGLIGSRFVAIKLDAEESTPARYDGKRFTYSGIAQRFRVTGYPTTIFLRANGEHIVSAPGYITPERFRLMLQYVGEDWISKGVRWTEFEAHGGPPPGR